MPAAVDRAATAEPRLPRYSCRYRAAYVRLEGELVSIDSALCWAANWYMTRRHIVDGDSTHALCSPYTTVWPDGYYSSNHEIPASDDPATMNLKACGLCTRKAKQ